MRRLIIVSLLALMIAGCSQNSHLNVPTDNFGGILANNFGGTGTWIVFGPTAGVGLSDKEPANPVNPGYDFVITDIDYHLMAGPAAVCNAEDRGEQVSLVISVNGVRNYLLNGQFDDKCTLSGRDYMTAGFVVRAEDDLGGGATCTGCTAEPIAMLQLRGYVVPQEESP